MRATRSSSPATAHRPINDEWQNVALNYALTNVGEVATCKEIGDALAIGAGEPMGGLLVKSAKLYDLVGGDMQKLAGGFIFTEGPDLEPGGADACTSATCPETCGAGGARATASPR